MCWNLTTGENQVHNESEESEEILIDDSVNSHEGKSILNMFLMNKMFNKSECD